MVRFAALTVAVGLLASVAAADPMLDQSYDPTTTEQELFVSSFIDRAQTFTVGLTGILTSVEVKVLKTDDTETEALLLDIRTTTMGAPTEADAGSNILGSASLAPASISTSAGFVSADLSALTIGVSAGDVLALVLRSAGDYRWLGTAADGYSGGASYFRTTTTWSAATSTGDTAFKTFVDPMRTGDQTGPIPEPAVVALLAAGGGVLLLRRRRRSAE